MALTDWLNKKENETNKDGVEDNSPTTEKILLKEATDYLTTIHEAIKTVAASVVSKALNGDLIGTVGSIDYLRQHNGSVSLRGNLALAPICEVNDANASLLKYASAEVVRGLEINSQSFQKAVEAEMARWGYIYNRSSITMLEFSLPESRKHSSYFDNETDMFTLSVSGNYQRPQSITLFNSVKGLKDDLEKARNYLFVHHFDRTIKGVVSEMKTRHDNVYVNFLATEVNLMNADGSFSFKYPRKETRENDLYEVNLDIIRSSFNEGQISLTFSTGYLLEKWTKRLSVTSSAFYEKLFSRYLPDCKVEVEVIEDNYFNVTLMFK